MTTPRSIRTIRDGAGLLSAQGGMMLVAIVWLAVLTRTLNAAELAAWALLEPLLAFGGTLSALGLSGTLYQWVPEALSSGRPARARWLARLSVVLPTMLVIPVALVVVAFADPLAARVLGDAQHGVLVRALAVAMVSGRFYEQVLLTLSALDRIPAVAGARVLHDLPVRFGALAVLLVRPGFEGVILAYALGETLLACGLLVRHRDALLGEVDSAGWGVTLRHSLPFYLNGFLRLATMQADKVAVGLLLGPQALAAYYLAARFLNFALVLVDSLQAPLLPKLSAVKHEGPVRLGEALARSSRFLAIAVTPVTAFLAATAPALVDWISAGRYPEAGPVLRVLAGVAFLYSLHGLYGGLIYVAAPPVTTTRLEAWGSVTALTLVAVLGSSFGLIGVASARLISGGVMTILGRLLARPMIARGLDGAFLGRVAWRVAVCAIPVAILVQATTAPALIVAATVAAVALTILLVLRVVSPGDWALVTDAVPSRVPGLRRGLDRLRPSVAAGLAAAVLAFPLGDALAQGLSVADVQRLRDQATGAVDGLDADALESALRRGNLDRAQRTTLDSLRARTRSGLDVPELTPTPPPERTLRDSVTVDDEVEPELEPFGYDLFEDSPDGFGPGEWGPVSDEYVLGPGDELVLTLWGDTESVQGLSVDREGRAFVRDVGLVAVGGRSLADVRRDFGRRLAEVYSGMSGRDGIGPSTWFDLTVASVRTTQVFVLGEVVRPGAYRVAANATALDLLFRAGGPRRTGSLRAIKVMRGGVEAGSVDLYRTLLAGELDPVTFRAGDVLHVPVVGPRVAVRGEVFREALYEVRADESLLSLLRAAGGLTATASLDRATVRRVRRGSNGDTPRDYGWEVLTVGRNELLGVSEFSMRDGDELRVDPISEEVGQFVEFAGDGVYRPGRIAWRSGLTLEAALSTAGGLTPHAHLEAVQVVRHHPDRSESMLALDLTGGGLSAELADRDLITIPSRWDFTERDSVEVVGPVREAGRYPLPSGMTLRDLLTAAGGLEEVAHTLEAEVARLEHGDGGGRERAEIIRVPIADWQLPASEAGAFPLEPRDVVYLRHRPGWEHQPNVSITGEVRFPGTYSISHPGERLSSLVARAGGLLPTAYPEATEFQRTDGDAGRIAVDLARALERPGEAEDLALVEGDAIVIPEEPHTVKVFGEVGFPSSILFRKGERVNYYLEQAGGLTDLADADRIRVQRANGEIGRGRGGFLRSGPRVDAGTIIFVPEREVDDDGTSWGDVANIINVLSGAATTVFLIHQVTQ